MYESMNEDKKATTTIKEIVDRINLTNNQIINGDIINSDIDNTNLTNYFIDIYENTTNRNDIIDYDVFMVVISNYLDGLTSLFRDDNYILYGTFIHDILFSGKIDIEYEKNDEKMRKFYIAPKTRDDIKKIENILIKLSYSCVKETKIFRYYLGQNIIIINKEPIENIIMLFKKISTNAEFENINKCVYVVNKKILVHPYCHLNYTHKDNLEILNNLNENNDIYIVTKSIVYDSLDTFVKTIGNQKCTQELSNILFDVCIILEKYDHLDVLIKHNFNVQSAYPIVPNKTIYDAIKQNNLKYIEFIIKNNVNLNILNDVGLTPIEYALKRNKKLTEKKIIMELNKFRYNRNPKWYDMMHMIKVYNMTKKNALEEIIYAEIITLKIQTIIELNNCIIRNMLKNNMTNDALEYLKQNYNFVNQNMFIEDIQTINMGIIFYYFDEYIQVTTRLIEILFDMNMYERILSYKSELSQYKTNSEINVDVRSILKYLIIKKNAKGLIFMFTKIDKELSQIRFENNDTILHKLCHIQNSDDNFMDIYKVYKVIVYYYPESILICDDNGN